jgi:tetratricopeptide (TPR) repeat protein
LLRAGDEDKAIAAYRQATELDSSPLMFNNVAYELADANKKLPTALEYAEKAVRAEEEVSQKVKLSELGIEDLGNMSRLAAFWDTLGWVHFRMGNLDQAEKYLRSAWELSQDWGEADHLGQVYERQHNNQAAARMYRLALYRFPQQPKRQPGESEKREPGDLEKTRARLQHLIPGSSTTQLRSDTEASTEVNRLRTIKLARLMPGTESAEVFVVFAPDPKTSSLRIEDVKFISGSEKLKSAGTALMSANFQVPFSASGHARLLRRGIIGCYQYSGCSLTLLNPADVHSVN